MIGFTRQIDGGLAEKIEGLLHADSTTNEGRIFLFREDRQTAIDDRCCDGAGQIFQAISGVVLLRRIGFEVEDGNRGAWCFRFEMVQHSQLRRWHELAAIRRRSRRGARLQTGKRRDDLALHGCRIDVADDHHGHQLGSIPCIVEIDEALSLRLFDHGSHHRSECVLGIAYP